ncbi:hypothetical protein [Ectobacillus sp. sgz5001026]|uniref:hypothetical protein n=1 Tax=Ectobacillus sp. sgz5001026 TaxID=3242473 RepID=UPI0036D23726
MFWMNRYEEHYNINHPVERKQEELLHGLSPGSIITQIFIRNVHKSFSMVQYEGMTGNIALFSGGSIPKPGLLRIRLEDIAVIIV